MPLKTKILVIDDDAAHAETLAEALNLDDAYSAGVANSGNEGLVKLSKDEYDIVISDLKMPDIDGIQLLKKAKAAYDTLEVVILTGHGTVDTAVEAMQAGALTYLKKPFNLEELRAVIARATERIILKRDNLELRRRLDKKFGFDGIIGNSPKMAKVFDLIKRVAATDATILIYGESGTGKELVAASCHTNSRRKNAPFVALNCAALSEGLLESELFGHEKGAFTGATATRAGKFEYADGGTLLLDEIGDMPMPLQLKMLRVLETGEVTRVGANKTMKVDVRIIAATNQNLDKLVKESTFREDLYFRLNVVRVNIPPLRERREDIPVLAAHFLAEFNEKYSKKVQGFTPEARTRLLKHDWAGNVRRLKNLIESLVAISSTEYINAGDIDFGDAAPDASSTAITPGMTIDEMEAELIRSTLALTEGNREQAARMLDIGERTLYRKIKSYGLS